MSLLCYRHLLGFRSQADAHNTRHCAVCSTWTTDSDILQYTVQQLCGVPGFRRAQSRDRVEQQSIVRRAVTPPRVTRDVIFPLSGAELTYSTQYNLHFLLRNILHFTSTSPHCQLSGPSTYILTRLLITLNLMMKQVGPTTGNSEQWCCHALIKLQEKQLDTDSNLKKFHWWRYSWCLPPIAIEIIAIRRQRELKSEFVADRDRGQRNSPPAVAPRVGFYSRSRSIFIKCVPFVGARVQFMTIMIPSSREKCTRASLQTVIQSYRQTLHTVEVRQLRGPVA